MPVRVRAVATMILVRHGRTSANADGVLAGRAPGVRLDDVGRDQAAAVARRLAALSLARLVTSPLARTVQTARAVAEAQAAPVPLVRDNGLVECGYGAWTGRALKDLAKEPLWRTVQSAPSAVTFPAGEAMADMSRRAVRAARRHDAEVTAEHGDDAVWAVVSHGDVIKAVVADALGLHLDAFQRIVVAPASLCVVRYTGQRPFVVSLNDTGGDLTALRPAARTGRRRRRSRGDDAAVGGGA